MKNNPMKQTIYQIITWITIIIAIGVTWTVSIGGVVLIWRWILQ